MLCIDGLVLQFSITPCLRVFSGCWSFPSLVKGQGERLPMIIGDGGQILLDTENHYVELIYHGGCLLSLTHGVEYSLVLMNMPI